MSRDYIVLIPGNPGYIPEVEARRRVEEQLSAFLPRAKDVSSRVNAEIQFIHPGGNLERVLCPNCGAQLDWDWWTAAMDAAYMTHYRELSVNLPCCGAMSSLNDLHYEFPAGFALFALQAERPDSPGLDAEQMGTLERIVGSPLRQIWVHL